MALSEISELSHTIHGAGIYANIGGILMVNVTIYGIHGSYGYGKTKQKQNDKEICNTGMLLMMLTGKGLDNTTPDALP